MITTIARSSAPRLLAAILATVSAQALAAATGAFVAHPTTPSFGTGDSTRVVLADIDGDGDLDAVVANQSSGAETVWLNNGAGAFTAHPTTPSFGGGNSLGMAMGDIDGDGDLDIVVANGAGQAETVWVNDGAGAFSLNSSFGAGSSSGVALGDIDGDGDLDAVVINVPGPATVWLNDGTGSFSAHPTTPSVGGAVNGVDVVLRDIDGDGDRDMVISNNPGPATVWINNGTGSFSAHPTTPAFGSGNTTGMALGDIDGDGDLDAVIAHLGGQAETVWLNDGTGSFSAHPTAPSFGAGDSLAIALGDIDGDGDLDAVVANAGQAETVWLNNGTGVFSAHPGTPSFGAGTSYHLALGDINGDGALDVVVANLGGEAETVWLNVVNHTVLATAAPPAGGTASCTPNPVANGGASTCTATPNAGYTFTTWSGDCTGATCNLVNVTAAKSVTANFTLNTYAIATAVSPVGGGTASCTPNPVSHGSGSTCTATPNAGYTFTNWSGDCTGATCNLVNVTAAQSVTANFTLNTYAITTAVSPVGGGTASCAPNPVNHGATSTCTATPNPGFAFVSWSGDCTGATCTLAGVTSAKNVTATFSAVTYAVATAVSPAGSGTVTCTPNPVGHAGTSTCTATPNAGFAFVSWSGDCTGATCTLTNVTSAKSVTAAFSAVTYAVTTAVSPAGSGTVTCTPNPVGHAGSSTCTATANAGFVFTSWSGDCTGATCTLTNVTAAKSVTASFAATLRTYSGPSATGSGTITASFTGGGAACTFTTPSFIAAPPGSPPVPPSAPVNVLFPHGLFDFTTSGCTPGSTITMTITYPAVLPAGTLYWKYGPEPGNATPHWYVLPASIAGNTVTFSITDGAQGDDDLTANGTIVDQGGPGVGGGAGGPHQTPTLSEWAMILLALLMLGLAARPVRRRRVAGGG